MPAAPRSTASVAGLLLTGGRSRRMGADKAALLIDGEPAAVRLARVLTAVAAPVVEVGPGRSGLPAVAEDPPDSGPLAAVGAGTMALRAAGHHGPAVVLACDLPRLTVAVVAALAAWPGDASVVPVVDGRAQPLCARWSARDLAAGLELLGSGARAMSVLVDRPGVVFVDESAWPVTVTVGDLADADTPEELDRLGLDWQLPPPAPAAGHDP